MAKRSAITWLLLTFGLTLFTGCEKKMDRQDLVVLMDQYLEALAKHDPSALSVASDVKLVENTKVIRIGEGLWETATGGPRDFRIYIADPAAGQVGFIGVIEEHNKPTILGARLKVVDGSITEIDHLVIHSGDRPLHLNMLKVRANLLEPVRDAERAPREEMLEIANLYYEAIVQDNGEIAPFADTCQRRENGGISANDQTQTPEEAAQDDFSVFRKMKCGEQLSTSVMESQK
jgi:hypothetical protein